VYHSIQCVAPGFAGCRYSDDDEPPFRASEAYFGGRAAPRVPRQAEYEHRCCSQPFNGDTFRCACVQRRGRVGDVRQRDGREAQGGRRQVHTVQRRRSVPGRRRRL